MPTKPLALPDAKDKVGQRYNRYPDTFFDQHRHGTTFAGGRPWWGFREYAANRGDPDAFCTDLQPGDHEHPMDAGWNAPWIPPFVSNVSRGSYFDFDYRRRTVRIRYDLILADYTTGEDAYYAAAAKLAGRNGWGEVRRGVPPIYQITALIGDPPRSPKIVQAAMAGDRWLLGFTDEPNESLAKLLGLTTLGHATEPAEGVLAPAQVMRTDGRDLDALIADAVAKALAAERAKQASQAATMRHAKAKKRQQTPTAADAA